MKLREYYYVIAIAEQKNITKAAEILYISQPALSRFLYSLEDELGTPLFKRVNKELIPTYAGEKFIEAGRQMISIQNKLQNSINQISQEKTGRINLSITSNHALYLLPAILPHFHKIYPDFYLNVNECSISDLENNIRNGSSDLGIYAAQNANPEFESISLTTEEVVLCLPASSPYLQYTVNKEGFKHPWIDLNYLKNETFYVNDPTRFTLGRFSQLLFNEYGFTPTFSMFRNLETCLSLASRGTGIAFCFDISEKYFTNYPTPPVYLSVGTIPHTVDLRLIYRRGYSLSPIEEHFIQILKKELASS